MVISYYDEYNVFKTIRRKNLMVMMLGICPLWVYAQSRLDSIQHLDEITVVAKSFREVIPSQKLSGKELQKLNSHSVADALRYFPGYN